MASVYHISPPDCRVKADYLLVFDPKGRLVADLGGGTIGEYGGRYSTKAARHVVAFFVNGFGVSNVKDEDVTLVTNEKAQEIAKRSKYGGFQVFVSVENVPKEKTIYLKAIYLLEFGNTPFKVTSSPDIVRTSGEEDEGGIKKILARYLKDRYQYWVEPEEIHFLKERDREKFEALTA
jgi:hypothetical protein